MKVQSLNDALVFSKLAKEAGAHGIFLLDTRDTASVFLGFIEAVGNMEVPQPTIKSYRFRVMTSIGTVWGHDSTTDSSEAEQLQRIADDIGCLFVSAEATTTESNGIFNLQFDQ